MASTGFRDLELRGDAVIVSCLLVDEPLMSV